MEKSRPHENINTHSNPYHLIPCNTILITKGMKMEKKLKKSDPKLYYVENREMICGANPDMTGDRTGLGGNCTGLWGNCSELSGDCSGLRGDCSRLRGDCTGLSGDCSELWGDCSGLRGDCSGLGGDCSGLLGNIDSCGLTDEDRRTGVYIKTLIED